MKNLSLLTFFVVMLCSSAMLAQQAQREVPKEEIININRAGVEEFKYFIQRFEAAILEKERASASTLLEALITRMNLQVSYNLTMSRTDADNPAWAERHKLQKDILQRVRHFRLDFDEPTFPEKANTLLQDLRKFAKSMEDSLTDVENWIRNH